MKKNYTTRLKRLQERRFDTVLQRAMLSDSFQTSTKGESVRYTLESMKEIDRGYTENTYVAAKKIQDHLTGGLEKKNIQVRYRYQGSVETNTHIKVHSDIDILVIIRRFIDIEPPLTPDNPYEGDSMQDLKELRAESFNILNAIYKQVDNSGAKAIKVFPTDPKRKVDVVTCSWLDTVEYRTSSDDKHAGVCIYNRDENSRSKDFPFLHIHNVNEKDKNVQGGLRRLVRLLKTLKVDAEYEINLSSFEITSIVYAMSNQSLTQSGTQQLLLLVEGLKQLNKLITEADYRENLRSPNNKEFVFGKNSSKVVELRKLANELDELLQDIDEEQRKGGKNINEDIRY